VLCVCVCVRVEKKKSQNFEKELQQENTYEKTIIFGRKSSSLERGNIRRKQRGREEERVRKF